MFDRNRGAVHTVVTAAFLSFVVILFVTAIWNMASRTAYDRMQAEAAAEEHASEAKQQIESRCIAMEPAAMAVCIRKVIKATREDERAEYDLAAQRGMDRWAFWMMWISAVSAGATALGVYWVRETLVATRDAVKAADDAVLVTRESSQFQSRAWVSMDLSIKKIRDNNPTENGVFFNIECVMKNHGNSPAINASFHAELVFPAPNLIEMKRSLEEYCTRKKVGRTPVGETVFPGTSVATSHMVFIGFDEIDRNRLRPMPDFILPAVLCCVNYEVTFDRSVLQTGAAHFINVENKGLASAISVRESDWYDQPLFLAGPGVMTAE